MNVIERAKKIRDALLERPAQEWDMTLVEGIVAPTLAWKELSAVLWNERHMEIRESNFSKTLRQPSKKSPWPPYTLEVWIEGQQVISISWTAYDEITQVTMMQGDWEAEYFDMPIPSADTRTTWH